MTINLSNHLIWQEFTEILNEIDLDALVANHLKACNYKVIGYQDENDFYEEIEFITPIEAEFISGSLNVTSKKKDESGWITINFLLKAAPTLSARISRFVRHKGHKEMMWSFGINSTPQLADWSSLPSFCLLKSSF